MEVHAADVELQSNLNDEPITYNSQEQREHLAMVPGEDLRCESGGLPLQFR